MKSQRPPEPPHPTDPSAEPSKHTTKRSPDITARQLFNSWQPRTAAEAKAMIEDSLNRASGLAHLIEEYSWGCGEDDPWMREPLGLLADSST
jgi:hypothetical protein